MKLIDNNNFIKKALTIVCSIIIIIGRSATSSNTDMKLKNINSNFTLTANTTLAKQLTTKTNHKEYQKTICVFNDSSHQIFLF